MFRLLYVILAVILCVAVCHAQQPRYTVTVKPRYTVVNRMPASSCVCGVNCVCPAGACVQGNCPVPQSYAQPAYYPLAAAASPYPLAAVGSGCQSCQSGYECVGGQCRPIRTGPLGFLRR